MLPENLKKQVFVAHPLLQHSHQMALALSECDLLLEFLCGVPVIAETSRTRTLWKNILPKAKIVDIKNECLSWSPIWPLLTKIAQRYGDAALRHDNVHRVFHLFDLYASLQVLRLRPCAVVAYENSAMKTFEAAKKIGAICILEAPSLHYKKAQELITIPSRGYLEEVNRRKDQEILLADHIITCSTLAGESYISNGTPERKVLPLLLGANSPREPRPNRSEGVPRFIFAGTMSERKSIDILLEVFSSLNINEVRAELQIFGGSELQVFIDKARSTPGVNYTPNISQEELARHMAMSDCLILVSRFDSFGMVVAEAMSTGTPALVSNMTGAKEIIEQFPGSGWIVDATFESISNAITYLVNNPSLLTSASKCAHEAHQNFTWKKYRTRASEAIKLMMKNQSL